MISTRCIGYDHIDIAYAKKAEMAVSHITHDLEGVTECTVMMMLMAIKRMTPMLEKLKRSDFTTNGLVGSELKEITVEIISAGKIGRSVLRDLSGFECKLLYSGRHRNMEADRYTEYVPSDDLLVRSDIISPHLRSILKRITSSTAGRCPV